MKKVLIVGATSAIAKECARLWAGRDKAQFFLVGRDSQALNTIKQDLSVLGASQVNTYALDLNQTAEHENLVNQIWSDSKGIDLALTAHGILGNQDTAEKNTAELVALLNTNFVSHVSILSLLGEKFKQQRSGQIAVISSVAGDRGKQSNFIYGAAMAGKSTYTDGLRNRLFPYGVAVTTLKLGFVDTPMTKDFKKGPLWASAEKAAAAIDKSIQSGKDTAYIPAIWFVIMTIIKSVPEFIFKKLKL